MSRTRPDRVDVVLLTYPCERCGAAPGDWCIANPDAIRRWAIYPHASRFRQATAAGRLPLPDPAADSFEDPT